MRITRRWLKDKSKADRWAWLEKEVSTWRSSFQERFSRFKEVEGPFTVESLRDKKSENVNLILNLALKLGLIVIVGHTEIGPRRKIYRKI